MGNRQFTALAKIWKKVALKTKLKGRDQEDRKKLTPEVEGLAIATPLRPGRRVLDDAVHS